MKTKALLLIVLSITACSFGQKSAVKSKTTYLNPQTGFKGTLTVKYQFGKCFGDLVIAYGYEMDYQGFNYKGITYSASELNLRRSLESYQTSTQLTFNVYPEQYVNYKLNTIYDNAALENYNLGMCAISQNKIVLSGDEAKLYYQDINKLNKLHANITSNIGYEAVLESYAEGIEVKKEKDKKYNSAIQDYSYSSTTEDKLNALKEAQRNASTQKQRDEVKKYINELEQQIRNENDRKKEEEITKREKERERKLLKEENEREDEIKKITEEAEKEKKRLEDLQKSEERKVSEKKREKIQGDLYDSENRLLDQAKSLRDEANSMVVEYRFQQEYKDKMLREADRIEKYVENSRSRRRFVTVGSDETGRQSAAVNAYNERMNYANEVNSQIAAESAAATLGLLYILGGVIYDNYGQNDGEIYKQDITNIHLGIDVGFSSSTAPVFLASEYRQIDITTDEEFLEEFNKPGQPITVNLGANVQFGVESNNYRGKIYGGIRAGISPFLDATHLQFSYGAQLSLGFKNIKILGGYGFRHRGFTLSNTFNEQEEGKGKSNIRTQNTKLGLEFSWYGSKKAYGRNHISFGVIQDHIKNLGTNNFVEVVELGEVTVGDFTYNAEGQAGFILTQEQLNEFNDFTDIYKFNGVFFEWRHDHHGTLSLEYIPNYAHTGIIKPEFLFDDWDKAGGFLFTISFTRNFDWFFNK